MRISWDLSVKDLEAFRLKNADSYELNLSRPELWRDAEWSGPNEGKKKIHDMSNMHNGNETENCLLEKCIRHLKYLESIILQAQF